MIFFTPFTKKLPIYDLNHVFRDQIPAISRIRRLLTIGT